MESRSCLKWNFLSLCVIFFFNLTLFLPDLYCNLLSDNIPYTLNIVNFNWLHNQIHHNRPTSFSEPALESSYADKTFPLELGFLYEQEPH